MKILVELPGRLVDAGDRATSVAVTIDDNPLAPGWDPAAAIGAAAADRPLILWSGSCGSDLFDGHPHTWGAPGWDALARVCAALTPGLEARGVIACFRPHARHVLSDGPSCRRFLSEHAGLPFGLALAPALMLEPSMLPEIEDHLTRIFEAVGGEARFLFLGDVAADGDACRAVPLGEGVMPREHVLKLIGQYLPSETPIVVAEVDLARQVRWLDESR